MLVLLLHESIAEVGRDHCFDAFAVFTVQGVVFAVAVVVHVVRSDVASDLGLFVQTLEFFSLGVAVVFKGDWVVC